MERTFNTPGPITIRARLASGEVTVDTTEEAQTEVVMEAGNEAGRAAIEKTRVDLHGTELTVQLPERGDLFGSNPEIRLRLRCPHGSGLEIRTASANVLVHGRLGDLDLHTASGDVDVGRVDGRARLNTASGDVHVGHGGGPLDIDTTSGDVTVEHAAADLEVNLVSGDLRVGTADGGARIGTVSGGVILEEAGAGAIQVHTVSGDIHVGVRPECNVWMDIHSLSGETISDLEPQEAPAGQPANLVELRAETVSGDIRVGRAAARARA
jgi:DUF4097 and DUF4098 domain-containing protein YvlB